MRYLLAPLLMMLQLVSISGHAGEFSPKSIELEDSSTNYLKVLKHDISYRDDNNEVWKSNRGDVTDGASIPLVLQGIVGDPFDPSFIRAAVIHDRYCDKKNGHRVRSWRQTHRVFYEMLLVSGIDPLKAKIMYYAVYNFGPKWGYLDTPIICGPNCIQSAESRYYEQNEYQFHAASIEEWQTLLRALEKDPTMEVAEIEELGATWRGNDSSFDLDGVQP